MSPTPLPLQLVVQPEPSRLKVRLQNSTAHAVRVWDPANSWGGAAWSVVIKAAGARHAHELRPNKQPYTVNLPRFIEVPAQGSAEVVLEPGGLAWAFGEDLSALRDVALDVRVALDIATSKEATAQNVAMGRIESRDVKSQPPHTWLFHAAGAGR
jgi:hypothetical protein